MSDMLTSKEAARRLSLSVKEVREMLRTGALPGTKVKNRWQISKSDLNKRVRDDKRKGRTGQGEVANALIKILGGTRRRR